MSARLKPTKTYKPLNEKEVIRALQTQALSLRQLLKTLKLFPTQRRELVHLLRKLLTASQVIRLRQGRYGLAQPKSLKQGRLMQTQAGFGFVVLDKQDEPDLYIAGENLKDAMPDDVVEVQLLPEVHRAGPHRRGRVVRVVKRARDTMIGTFYQSQRYAFLRPYGMPLLKDFFIPPGKSLNARDGDLVVGKIITWPNSSTPGEANLIEILGVPDQPGLDITLIIKQFGLPDRFSDKAWQQAQHLAQEPGPSAYADRLDLRSLRIVTIDGADARDFDDAVSCEPGPAGSWRLGVHIADVSYYLTEGSVLDLEARERGTSVYFPDRVLHMLPEPLSCGVCSLMPHQNRLTVSVFMQVAADGRVTQVEFKRSIIRSAARLTYDWVEDVLQAKLTENPAQAFAAELQQLNQVAQALRYQRQKRGSLDFDLPDSRVVVGKDGRVKTIEKIQPLASHRLIEDCMIAANEAVARYLARTGTPTLFRVHESPNQEKLEELKLFLKAYGYILVLGKKKQNPKRFQMLLASWQGKPEADILNKALLRSLQLAVYAPKNIGHFGLASACYTHFTSPIRRYPDLLVHRALLERLVQGPRYGSRHHALTEQLPEWGKQLSEAERRAEKAERQAVKMKQLEFMEGKIGEIFSGRVTTITHFGFFVELEDYFVEGLVLAKDLKDDFYYFKEHSYLLVGVNTGRVFSCGDRVQIVVERVDRDAQQVLFRLVAETSTVATGRPASARILHRPKGKRL